MLIAARAVLGIAGVALTACTPALISGMFPDQGQRATTIGVRAGSFTIGAIVGPITGGVLLTRFRPDSVLLLGSGDVGPAGGGPGTSPEYRDPVARRLDPVSVACPGPRSCRSSMACPSVGQVPP
jgi:DHA2 family multidrug resistance protein-like MFS transporter